MNEENILRGKQVLLLEDNFLVGTSVAAILRRIGCAVIGPVATLDDARHALEHERIDGAVLDVNVIGGTSYPIAEALQRRGAPFIFVTGYKADELMPESLRTIRKLPKPVADTALEAALTASFAAS